MRKIIKYTISSKNKVQCKKYSNFFSKQGNQQENLDNLKKKLEKNSKEQKKKIDALGGVDELEEKLKKYAEKKGYYGKEVQYFPNILNIFFGSMAIIFYFAYFRSEMQVQQYEKELEESDNEYFSQIKNYKEKVESEKKIVHNEVLKVITDENLKKVVEEALNKKVSETEQNETEIIIDKNKLVF
jgi:hypothetical protein